MNIGILIQEDITKFNEIYSALDIFIQNDDTIILNDDCYIKQIKKYTDKNNINIKIEENSGSFLNKVDYIITFLNAEKYYKQNIPSEIDSLIHDAEELNLNNIKIIVNHSLQNDF